MHGIGNDFVVVDLVDHPIDLNWPELALQFCRSHFGIGADGLLLLSRDPDSGLRMTMYNPDGSHGGMCGNGVRCVSKLAVSLGYVKDSFDLRVEQRTLQVEAKSDQVAVNMGCYSLRGSDLGLSEDATDPIIGLQFAVGSFSALGTAVSMGNPHLVLLVEDVEAVDVESIGRQLEYHSWFQNRCNVQFVEVLDWTSIRVRTWERGAGMTLACGSGACASAVASSLAGKTSRKVLVRLPGGDLNISVLQDASVIMSGPAEVVFTGEWKP